MKNYKNLVLCLLSFLLILSACSSEGETPTPIDLREAWVGTWEVSENFTFISGQTGVDNYTITIAKHPTNDTKLRITNFANLTKPDNSPLVLDAFLLSNSLMLDAAEVPTSSGNFSFVGSIQNETLNYKAFKSGVSHYLATGTAIKQ